jgi:hypothetical protein
VEVERHVLMLDWTRCQVASIFGLFRILTDFGVRDCDEDSVTVLPNLQVDGTLFLKSYGNFMDGLPVLEPPL